MLCASLSACSVVNDIKGKFMKESQDVVTTPTLATIPETNATTPATGNAGITFDTYALTLSVGESALLSVQANNQTGLKWRSTNENVALVNRVGTVTAVGEGVANISCTSSSGAEAVCTVTVTAAILPTEPPVPESQDVFPHSSEARLTEQEIAYRLAEFTGETPTGSYAQDAINEIYARHGYPFTTASIRAFYEKQGWYTPRSDFSMDDLTSVEKANIALLNDWLS